MDEIVSLDKNSFSQWIMIDDEYKESVIEPPREEIYHHY